MNKITFQTTPNNQQLFFPFFTQKKFLVISLNRCTFAIAFKLIFYTAEKSHIAW